SKEPLMNRPSNRHLFFTLPVIGLLIVLLAGVAGATSTNITYFKSVDLIRKVMELIKSDYVDENIDEQKLIYGAIEGMLGTLDDPYTRFMEPKAFKEMQTETQGEFGGLGIVITVKNKVLTVISPIEDTPAFRAGIKAGDMIIKIDGKDVADIALHDAVKLLRGPEGTKVTINVFREGDKEAKDYTLIREVIKIPSIKFWVIKPNIGYIRLTQFIQTSAEDLEKAMIALEKEKVTSIILDLRNNPGGLLTAAVEVGRKFIPKGDIVSIKSRDGEKSTYSSFFQSHPLLPLVVLVNEGSASASEIVAGAIKDNKRGLLVGRKSFGKGSVQTVISLNDGSAMALTTALYYTPSGVNIHKKGIEPDINVELPKLTDADRDEITKTIEAEEKQQKLAENATQPAELASGTPLASTTTAVASLSGFIEPADSLSKGSIQYYVINRYDTQLQRAVDVLKSAEIFGGLKQ
ncbi:MAG TPA: S41 family peptidase, partial [Candidatus Ozemobacteraceae bacterium]|nr:S41 family peptidase [Candidatus Ozemobacteraceae bacterium]